MNPMDRRIHLGLGNSPELPWRNDSVAKSLFSGHIFESQNVPEPTCRPWVQKIWSWAQKSAPGHEHTKDARWKTTQNPVFGIANGAILCKLWPKTILKGHLKILVFASRRKTLFSKMGILCSKRGSLGLSWTHCSYLVTLGLSCPMWFAGVLRPSGTNPTGEQA